MSYSDRKVYPTVTIITIIPIVTMIKKLLENVFYQNARVIQARERYGIQETGDLTQKS